FLADEPVQARPPSAGYRMKKFLRRNKGPAIAAALVFLALIAGFIGTSIGLVQAEWARERAEKLAKEKDDLAIKEHKTAEDNELLAIKAKEDQRAAEKMADANKLL